MISETAPTLTPMPPGTLPVQRATPYCRRHTNHVVIGGGEDEVTLSFGQFCAEEPQAPVIEMFASLSLTRRFAQQVVELLQQQLRSPMLGR